MIKTNVNFAREATSLGERIAQNLKYSMGKRISDATPEDIFYALVYF